MVRRVRSRKEMTQYCDNSKGLKVAGAAKESGGYLK